ncbi:BZIP family transcriptional factor [Mycena indigotica]|uniref:BZIP family transcriptional factor n=1 Tax=Mycena indigotica TaxID=2126181 RepID=A0A8H6SVW5_9AGAR|nr:BZIP family transcriptional factor [Mycena indigotica]KAF7306426.1 BZIP family transcriptional factor [Mycena indigotica]
MDSYTDMSPLWDLSQPTNFSQLPDDDFLALLQKQFPTGQPTHPYSVDFGLDGTGVNPQSISHYSLPSLTPPSADSSPSPPEEDNSLKRKASADDLEEGPSKSQHTLSNGKKGTARRKSSGNGPDDARLMKRKEQNRAAQRAFRERKEKHVKDLEDKVAALEAKNDQASSENENLRDLLARLQNENVMLKQKQSQQFTFSVPKGQGASAASAATAAGRSPATSISAASPSTSAPNPLDWSSLTAFDPAVLNLLDDTPQQTATDDAMKMNFGFNQPVVQQQKPSTSSALSNALSSFTTIASNPMFTSFASAFDMTPPHHTMTPGSSSAVAKTSSSSKATPTTTASANTTPFSFDMPSSLSAWSTPNPDNTFDDLFGGIMGSAIDFNEFNVLMQSPNSSISPVTHHATLNSQAGGHSPANSTTSSLSSRSSDPLFNTPRESSSDSDFDLDGPKECPKSKDELRDHISSSGSSVFAPDTTPSLRKAESSVMCEGSAFPSTQASDSNLEILDAWRTVTSNPQFRDSDIAELCSEFSAKARCDGTKVVLEPHGVRTIIESLTQKHNRGSL